METKPIRKPIGKSEANAHPSAVNHSSLKRSTPLVHPVNLDERKHVPPEKRRTIAVIAVYSVLVLLGISTGYFLAVRSGDGVGVMTGTSAGSVTQTTTVDEKTFRDSAEGTMEKGGLDGEGTHRLIREGGPSQTAYLTSSVVDMDAYIGKKVKVWGETMAAEKAGWLMDVGKVELLSK